MARINIMGVGLDNITKQEALECAADRVMRELGGYIVTPNAEIVYGCRDDAALRELVNAAAMVVPDGIGVIYASRILKTPLAERVPGIELGEALIAWMAQHGKRLYLLGAKPGVAEQAAEKLCEKYPGLVIAGTHDGYYKEDAPVVAEMQAAQPDVALVCMGFPRQERFMAAHGAELPHTLMLGLGGSLYGYAGVAQRAPQFYCDHGLEWFYRLMKEPRRIGRMMSLPKFLLLVLKERFLGKKA